MARKHFVTAIIFGLTGVLSFACAEPNWAGEKLTEEKDANEASGDSDPKAGGDDDDDCVDTSAVQSAVGDDTGLGLDTSTLDACCKEDPSAKAYCVPEDKVGSSKDALTACEGGGRCLPESIIKGDVPKDCKSTALGAPTPGVCLSPCIKKVGDNKAALKADGCGAGLLCAPCELGGTPTGACNIGKSSGGGGGGASKPAPKKVCAKKPDEKPAPTPEPAPGGGGENPPPQTGGCCGDKGLCAPTDVIESRMPGKSKMLEAKECTGGLLCAPKENAVPGFKPKTCNGKSLTGAYKGVCLSNCINFSTLQKAASGQGDCDSDHRCMPCKILGVMDTDAPGCE